MNRRGIKLEIWFLVYKVNNYLCPLNVCQYASLICHFNHRHSHHWL